MGVPWFVVPMILAGSETLDIEVSEEGATITNDMGEEASEDSSQREEHAAFEFNLMCISNLLPGWQTTVMDFGWGEVFNMTYGKGRGVMWNTCTKDAPNVLMCRSGHLSMALLALQGCPKCSDTGYIYNL